MKLWVWNAFWITDDASQNTWKDLKETPFYSIQRIPRFLPCLQALPLPPSPTHLNAILRDWNYFTLHHILNFFVPNKVSFISWSQVVFRNKIFYLSSVLKVTQIHIYWVTLRYYGPEFTRRIYIQIYSYAPLPFVCLKQRSSPVTVGIHSSTAAFPALEGHSWCSVTAFVPQFVWYMTSNYKYLLYLKKPNVVGLESDDSKHQNPSVSVKVKWSRYRPGVVQRVGRGTALLFHDRGTRRGWVVSSAPRPHFTPGKEPVPLLQEAVWALGPVWKGEKSGPHRDSIPHCPARSQSLYRLSYPPHLIGM
jgi:hypothetical protein